MSQLSELSTVVYYDLQSGQALRVKGSKDEVIVNERSKSGVSYADVLLLLQLSYTVGYLVDEATEVTAFPLLVKPHQVKGILVVGLVHYAL